MQEWKCESAFSSFCSNMCSNIPFKTLGQPRVRLGGQCKVTKGMDMEGQRIGILNATSNLTCKLQFDVLTICRCDCIHMLLPKTILKSHGGVVCDTYFYMHGYSTISPALKTKFIIYVLAQWYSIS